LIRKEKKNEFLKNFSKVKFKYQKEKELKMLEKGENKLKTVNIEGNRENVDLKLFDKSRYIKSLYQPLH